MRFLLNLLWAVFGGGFITDLEYVLARALLCCTIIGIPFGVQCFKLAGLALFPFGKDFHLSRLIEVMTVAKTPIRPPEDRKFVISARPSLTPWSKACRPLGCSSW